MTTLLPDPRMAAVSVHDDGEPLVATGVPLREPERSGRVDRAARSVVPLPGHALTHPAGGPAIAALTTVLLLAWRSRTGVTPPAMSDLAALSRPVAERPLQPRADVGGPA